MNDEFSKIEFHLDPKMSKWPRWTLNKCWFIDFLNLKWMSTLFEFLLIYIFAKKKTTSTTRSNKFNLYSLMSSWWSIKADTHTHTNDLNTGWVLSLVPGLLINFYIYYTLLRSSNNRSQCYSVWQWHEQREANSELLRKLLFISFNFCIFRVCAI